MQFNNGVINSNGIDKPLFYDDGNSIVELSADAPKGCSIEIYKYVFL